jgi:hypothetical protein
VAVSGHQGKEGERPKILKQQSTFWSKTNKEERRRRRGGAFSGGAISRDGLYVKKATISQMMFWILKVALF